MKKIILLLIALVAVGVGGYIIGYKRSPNRAHQESAARFRIMQGIKVIKYLESGNTNDAIEDIRFVLWNDTESYERLYGLPSATNHFASYFSEAKGMTAAVLPALLKRVKNTPTVNQMVTNIFGSNSIESIIWN